LVRLVSFAFPSKVNLCFLIRASPVMNVRYAALSKNLIMLTDYTYLEFYEKILRVRLMKYSAKFAFAYTSYKSIIEKNITFLKNKAKIRLRRKSNLKAFVFSIWQLFSLESKIGLFSSATFNVHLEDYEHLRKAH